MAEHRTPPAAPAIPPLRIGGYDLASRLIMGTGGITDLTALEGRYLDQLSGGQRQRAYVAMVLAQDTDYLLLDEHPWRNLAGFFDTAWVLTPDESTRRIRLVERHERYGRSTEDARAHALGSDETNARRIEHNMVAWAGLTVLEVDPG